MSAATCLLEPGDHQSGGFLKAFENLNKKPLQRTPLLKALENLLCQKGCLQYCIEVGVLVGGQCKYMVLVGTGSYLCSTVVLGLQVLRTSLYTCMHHCYIFLLLQYASSTIPSFHCLLKSQRLGSFWKVYLCCLYKVWFDLQGFGKKKNPATGAPERGRDPSVSGISSNRLPAEHRICPP